MTDGGGDGASRHAEALDEAAADIVVDAVAGDDGHLDDVLGAVDRHGPVPHRQGQGEMAGDDLAFDDADDRHRRSGCRDPEILGGHGARLHAVEADRRHRRPAHIGAVVDGNAAGEDGRDCAGFEIVQQHDVGPLARRDHAAVPEAEGGRRGQRRRTIDGERRHAERNGGPDDEVEMAFFGNVEGIAVIGAEGEEGGGLERQERGEGMQVFRDRALADQHGHALADLFQGFVGGGRLVVGANARARIGIEIEAADERRMAVDLPIGKGLDLGQAIRVAADEAGHVHEFGEAEHFGMVAVGDEIGRCEAGARCFQMGRRHAGRELHPQIHDRPRGAFQHVVEGRASEHIGDFVGVADRRRDPVPRHAAIEFERRDERGFDMEMGVDEAGDGNPAAALDGPGAAIGAVGADDGVARYRDIGRRQCAGDEVVEPDVADHQVGRLVAAALGDTAGQRCRIDPDHDPLPLSAGAAMPAASAAGAACFRRHQVRRQPGRTRNDGRARPRTAPLYSCAAARRKYPRSCRARPRRRSSSPRCGRRSAPRPGGRG